MKKIITVLIFMCLFTFGVSAQTPDDIYKEQFDKSGVGELYQFLPKSTQKLLESMGIDPTSGQMPELSPKSVFAHIKNILAGGLSTPLKTCAALVGIMLLMTLITSAVGDKKYSPAAELAAVLCLCTTVMIPLYETVIAAVATLKSAAAFMMALIPVYCAILLSNGFVATAGASSVLMLGSAEAVTQLISFGLAPLMGMYLSLSISASVSPVGSPHNLADLIKKIANWALSAALTVFLGVLSLQTSVSASADTLSMRTARYLAGSIPLVGGAVGETISVVKGSLALLSSSAAGYGIIALAAILLPVLAELLIWRVCLNVCSVVCGFLGVGRMETLVRSCDTVFAFISGVTLYVGLLFIISLAVVSSSAGGGAV